MFLIKLILQNMALSFFQFQQTNIFPLRNHILDSFEHNQKVMQKQFPNFLGIPERKVPY